MGVNSYISLLYHICAAPELQGTYTHSMLDSLVIYPICQTIRPTPDVEIRASRPHLVADQSNFPVCCR